MSEKHRQLFESQQPQVQSAYGSAIASGMIDPAILILDVQDPCARGIITAHAESDEITAMLAECDQHGWAATLVLALPAQAVLQAYGTTLANCQRFFGMAPQAGHLRFGIISGGAVSWGTCAIKPSSV